MPASAPRLRPWSGFQDSCSTLVLRSGRDELLAASRGLSNVAPVTAVFRHEVDAGARPVAPTTLRIGRVARSSSRRCSRVSPEDARRQGRVDEAGGDAVGPDRGELDREVRGDHGQRRGGDRGDAEPDAGPPGVRTRYEDQRSRRVEPARGTRGRPAAAPRRCSSRARSRFVEIDVARAARRAGRPR